MSEILELNRGDLAKLLGVSLATIKNAIDSGAPGVLDRGSRGRGAKISAPAFVQWWVERERTKAGDQKRDAGSLSQQDQELDIALKNHKLQVLRNEVIDRAAAVAEIRRVHMTTASVIRGAPRRFGHRFERLPDRISAVEALTEMMNEICAELRRPETWLGKAEVRVSDDVEEQIAAAL